MVHVALASDLEGSNTAKPVIVAVKVAIGAADQIRRKVGGGGPGAVVNRVAELVACEKELAKLREILKLQWDGSSEGEPWEVNLGQ